MESYVSSNTLAGPTRLVVLAAIVAVGLGGYFLFLRTPPTAESSPAPLPPAPQLPEFDAKPPEVTFVDVTDAAGIDFVHTNGSTGMKLLPETMGSGCAFFDFDNDGDQDIIFGNSRSWRDAADAPGKTAPAVVICQNDGTGKFTDVTASLGINLRLFGMGVAVGDYDNDGFTDLFITAIQQDGNRLLHNEGGKRFVDVTVGDLATSKGWGTGAAFFDANNDGKLDLFVCNYVQWTPEIDQAQEFSIAGVGRAFGPPLSFQGSFCQLFLGDGTGRFTDVSAESGVQKTNPNTGAPMGKSLGVAAGDIDRDGWMDVVVANDTVQNFFFHNKGGGKFEEIGAEAGIAFDASGNARGAMGIDVAEYRDDGKVGIAIGNFANEMTGFYVNQDTTRLFFSDKAIAEGIGPPSQLLLKFGLFFFDYDLDGRLDVFTANGHLEDEINKVQASQTYAQPPQLFWNCGPDGRVVFIEVKPGVAGTGAFKPLVGRGAACADIDGDGDLDVLITANGGRPRLLRNEGGNRNHWLRVKLEGDGRTTSRDAIGAVVELYYGETIQRQELMGGRSYLSQCESVLTFGLGERTDVDELVIIWPGGTKKSLRNIQADQTLQIKQDGTSR
jgi:hypothetical protein